VVKHVLCQQHVAYVVPVEVLTVDINHQLQAGAVFMFGWSVMPCSHPASHWGVLLAFGCGQGFSSAACAT
jgi:hypothetical protein